MTCNDPMDEELGERRERRLEQRYRLAQTLLAGARAVYASLRELPGATDLQLHQAVLKLQRAQQQLVDIQAALELLEDQREAAVPRARGAIGAG